MSIKRSKALVAVVSLAVTLATMGAGAELRAGLVSLTEMSGASATFVSGMTQGAFTALCSRSAVSLLQNRGNVGHVLKDLTSKESLKGISISSLTQGVTNGMAKFLDMPLSHVKGFMPNLEKQMLSHSIGASINASFGDRHAFDHFFQNVMVDTVAAMGATEIGESYSKGDLNVVSHKLAHAFLGGTMGGVLEGKRGILSGAESAVLAESLMELTTPKQALGQSDEEYRKVLEQNRDMVRILVASVGLFTHQNIGLMDRVSKNALENNSMSMMGRTKPLKLETLTEDEFAEEIRQLREDIAKLPEETAKVLDAAVMKTWGFVQEHPDQILDGVQGLLTAVSLCPAAVPAALTLQRIISGARVGYKVVKAVEGEALPTVKGDIEPVKVVVEDSVPVRALEGEVLPPLSQELVPIERQLQFWTQERTYTFRDQTNKVYQRPDLIDPMQVDPRTSLTNIQRMEKGLSPIARDNTPINLHHMIQEQSGALAEVTGGMHTKYHGTLHIWPNGSTGGVTRAEPRPSIDRQAFDKWKSDYWKERAKDFTKGGPQ